ncbi:MAG: hypothetical protein F6K31_23445 [Symploca sp. SIO2G7]|nr:hypothetical protein [Symploca sp. SIO2G7]
MPLKSSKKTVGATVTADMQQRIRHTAQQKHWSVAQTLSLFIDRYWTDWEKELGVEPEPQPQVKLTRRSRKTTTK